MKITAPKVLHGLIAAGTDIWALELSQKVLGQRYVPATVRVPNSLLFVTNTECSPVLSFLDIVFSCPIPVSLNVQLLGNNAHYYCVVLLPMGFFGSSF